MELKVTDILLVLWTLYWQKIRALNAVYLLFRDPGKAHHFRAQFWAPTVYLLGPQKYKKKRQKHEDMRTKSVSFTDPAKLRSLFGPCYAYALQAVESLVHLLARLNAVGHSRQLQVDVTLESEIKVGVRIMSIPNPTWVSIVSERRLIRLWFECFLSAADTGREGEDTSTIYRVTEPTSVMSIC